ncbi:hypothetical protein FF011L_38740 [Roseimaritima multifibrata]|uniref:Uncharacterized protein n=1 Tax=Roseimaritima multifibrata TaxID=1930274 RepID=A0A517MJS2_9BACT|nr:hypothetical protein FF011L_38740 [Roseimaritima multifibrata]
MCRSAAQVQVPTSVLLNLTEPAPDYTRPEQGQATIAAHRQQKSDLAIEHKRDADRRSAPRQTSDDPYRMGRDRRQDRAMVRRFEYEYRAAP